MLLHHTFILLVLSSFLAEHVKGHLILLILVGLCRMEAHWLPIVLKMLAHIPQCCAIFKVLVVDVHVLKGLPYLNIALWQGMEGMGRLVCSTGCTKQCHI